MSEAMDVLHLVNRTCPTCHGSCHGRQSTDTCEACDGRGYVSEPMRLDDAAHLGAAQDLNDLLERLEEQISQSQALEAAGRQRGRHLLADIAAVELGMLAAFRFGLRRALAREKAREQAEGRRPGYRYSVEQLKAEAA